jgi:Fe-S-cluster containining protein
MSGYSQKKRHAAGGKGGRFRRLEPASRGSVACGRVFFLDRRSPVPRRALFTILRSIRLYDLNTDMQPEFPASADRALVQIVDSALADAARRSGGWLVCRPGCSHCCVGVFPINQLDALRLRRGLEDLEAVSPKRAKLIRSRAQDAVKRLSAGFPGDAASGILGESAEAEQRFSDFANDEPCPALDPATGTCELYESRPITCRVFGPPVRSEGGLGVCELCFHGATDKEIASCEMKADPDDAESRVLEELEFRTGLRGKTIIAFCLAS